MFAKLLIVCAVAAAALATEYPAGLHPSVCPNYPHCDMEVLARHTPDGMPIPDWELPYARMVAAGMPIPDWELPYARMVARAPVKVHVPTVAKVGEIEYPADMDPASCPNYPYCS